MNKANKEIEYRKLVDLKKLPNNPRTIKSADMERLKQSIKDNPDYFEARPLILSNRTGELIILAGNQRYEAAKSLGMDEVPTFLIEGLTEEREREIVIRDNVSNGEWDMDALANEWDTQELTDWGVDINWDEPEQEVVEDEAPEVSDEPANSVLGGVYQLGKHRLMCGDSTDAGSVAILMDGQKADMVFTDPPYNIAYKGISDKRTIENDKMPEADFVAFLKKSIMRCPTVYVCCSWQYAHLFKKAMTEIGTPPKAMIVWDKINPAQHLDKYFKQHELIFYYGKFGGEKTLRGDVWQLKRQVNTVHPTMKPIELIAMALGDNKDAQKVYDGFGGSGSTLIACEQLGRKCYMMELDPKYCDVIRKRWWKLTHDGDEEGWEEGTPVIDKKGDK